MFVANGGASIVRRRVMKLLMWCLVSLIGRVLSRARVKLLKRLVLLSLRLTGTLLISLTRLRSLGRDRAIRRGW